MRLVATALLFALLLVAPGVSAQEVTVLHPIAHASRAAELRDLASSHRFVANLAVTATIASAIGAGVCFGLSYETLLGTSSLADVPWGLTEAAVGALLCVGFVLFLVAALLEYDSANASDAAALRAALVRAPGDAGLALRVSL